MYLKTFIFAAAILTLLTGAAAAQETPAPAPDRPGQAMGRMQNGLFGGRMADRFADRLGDRFARGERFLDGERDGVALLRAADVNQDGAATRAEVEGLLMEEFAWRDRNDDGVLNEDDASPMVQRLAARREARPLDPWVAPPSPRAGLMGGGDRTTADIGERVDRLFGALDGNADGQITAEEARTGRRGRAAPPDAQ